MDLDFLMATRLCDGSWIVTLQYRGGAFVSMVYLYDHPALLSKMEVTSDQSETPLSITTSIAGLLTFLDALLAAALLRIDTVREALECWNGPEATSRGHYVVHYQDHNFGHGFRG